MQDQRERPMNRDAISYVDYLDDATWQRLVGVLKLYEALDQLPQTLCHNDVFPRNLFVRDEGRPEQSVAIDWAFCGQGSVGQELAVLVGATQAFMESRPERWDDLERDCLDGYAEAFGRRAGRIRRDPPRLPSVDRPPFRHRRSAASSRRHVDPGAPRPRRTALRVLVRGIRWECCRGDAVPAASDPSCKGTPRYLTRSQAATVLGGSVRPSAACC